MNLNAYINFLFYKKIYIKMYYLFPFTQLANKNHVCFVFFDHKNKIKNNQKTFSHFLLYYFFPFKN